MENGDGALSFDFEIQSAKTLPSESPITTTTNLSSPAPETLLGAGFGRSFRKTVCRHWLRSLCMKGEACGFLHQYDKSKMPICRFFRLHGECREKDCVYKHTNDDVKECHMYKLGFCPNGRDCRYRHAKMPGPPPSVEEVLRKIQQMTSSYSYGNKSNRFFQNRNTNTNYSQKTENSHFPQGGPNGAYVVGQASTTGSGNVPQQPQGC